VVGYGVPVVIVPHSKPQLASHPAFGTSLETLRATGVRVLFDPDAPYERRLPPWSEVVDALPVRADASRRRPTARPPGSGSLRLSRLGAFDAALAAIRAVSGRHPGGLVADGGQAQLAGRGADGGLGGGVRDGRHGMALVSSSS
jgi:hypothetical protein